MSFSFLKEPSPDLFPTKQEFLKLLLIIAIAITVSIACNYTATLLNPQSKPFCDSNSETSHPESCEPCPENGKCFQGNLECIHGYKRYKGICIEDGVVTQTTKKLLELAEIKVCESSVQFLCEGVGSVWVREAEMWDEDDEVSLKEKFGLTNESYLYSKEKAMEKVESLLETQTVLYGVKEMKCPDWLAENYKPISCKIRLWVHSHALVLVPGSALLVGLAIILSSFVRKIRRRQYISTRAEQVYQQVCDILEENAVAVNNGSATGEPWVVASRLRDHLLMPRERKDVLLWKKVEELVQEDSRLDQYPKLVKGESKVVWEWQVEGSLSSSRKRVRDAERKPRSIGDTPKPAAISFKKKLLNFC